MCTCALWVQSSQFCKLVSTAPFAPCHVLQHCDAAAPTPCMHTYTILARHALQHIAAYCNTLHVVSIATCATSSVLPSGAILATCRSKLDQDCASRVPKNKRSMMACTCVNISIHATSCLKIEIFGSLDQTTLSLYRVA